METTTVQNKNDNNLDGNNPDGNVVKKDPMRPRRLTEDEIQDILSVVPELKSASSQVSRFNRKSMLKTLREQLREIIVTPLGIDDIKDEIVRQFNHSLIKPGSAVGVTAAEAMGQPITQMALNSFHQSGSSKNVSYGIDKMKEMFQASKNIKNPSCSIFFKNQNLSFDDVIIKVRPELTEITIQDIVKGIPDIESSDNYEEPWWYQPYRILIRRDFKSTSFLALDIDVNVMYSYKITMEDVRKVLEKDGTLICVYSPLNVGKIHIYPIERALLAKIKSEGLVDRQNAAMVFLWKVVIPALDKLKIKGVEGIRKIYPVEAPVWQIVKDEMVASEVKRGWFLILNEVRMKITGITVDKLVKLCKTVGMAVLKERPNYILVQTPTGGSPTIMVNDLIKADKEAEKEYEAKKRAEGARIIRRPPTEIMSASQLVYTDTDGSVFNNKISTLRQLLSNPNIDATRTYSNNVHEISDVLGIEAARSFLIKEFGDIITYEGHYVDPRHILLLVDFMVSLGRVNGITFTGISRQPVGALEKATIERAMESFQEAVGFGEKQEIRGTSASIYVGKKALIGTGYSDQYMDRSKFKETENELFTDPNMKLDIGATKDAINKMTDLVYGVDVMAMKGAEQEMFGGDGPAFPDSTVMFGGNKVPDIRVFDQIKGPLIRSEALNQAAINLNNAPCLGGPQPDTISVTDVQSTITMTGLPSVGPTEARLPFSTAPQLQPTTFMRSDMGLPEELLDEMKQFQYMEPPKVAQMPSTGLPMTPPLAAVGIGGFAPLPTTGKVEVAKIVTEEPEKKAVMMFNLDEFMK
jgi:hypothetical protein